MGLALGVALEPAVLLQLGCLVAKAVGGCRSARHGVFPLGLRRQAERRAPGEFLVELFDERLAIFPTYAVHRILRAAEMAGVVLHDGLPLFLRDLELAEVERLADGDRVRRLFLVLAFLIPHHERTRRDRHQLQHHSAAEIETDFRVLFRRGFRKKPEEIRGQSNPQQRQRVDHIGNPPIERISNVLFGRLMLHAVGKLMPAPFAAAQISRMKRFVARGT